MMKIDAVLRGVENALSGRMRLKGKMDVVLSGEKNG
jgi:hypothetical protein